jgi:N-acyl-D-aspartate/D-glutamate deacylase
MTEIYDSLIRRGKIVNGTGCEPFVGDLAIKDGIIIGVGKYEDSAREEIDAHGMIVTPGWVDIHTHYDGQATWDRRINPSP